MLFGRLGDVWGRRRLFVWGVALFALASLGCALAPSLGFLIAARIAQGVGAAMLEPSTLALIKATFPRGRLGLALGVQGIAAGIATAIGPTLGGVLTTTLSWRYIFLLNVPVGIVAIGATLAAVAESRNERASRRLDIPGIFLWGAGISLVVFALIEGEKLGWGSPATVGAFAAGALALVAFVLVERRVREPLMDLSLFADRLFAVGNALRALVLLALLGTVFALPLYWQTQLGYSALEAGLQLLPLSSAAFFFSPLAGSLADRVDVRWLVGGGFVALAGGALWLSRLTPASGWAFFAAPLALVGAGLALLLAPTATATLRNVPEGRSGLASGISFTAGELGSALGLALVAAVLQNRLIANVERAVAGAGLPPQVAEGIVAGLAGGTAGESAAPGLDGPLAAPVAGLLIVAAATGLGAVLALLCFSSPPGAEAGGATTKGSAASDGAAPVEGTRESAETAA